MLTRAVVFQLSGMRKLFLGNGERALLLICLRKVIGRSPINYRGITLLSVVGKVFCKVLNNRLVHCLDEGVLHGGQAGFRSCMDNVYTLNEIVQGRLKEDKETYAFFLDVQKT